MHRLGPVLLALALGAGMLAGCGGPKKKAFLDGEYRAEFADFDSYGYKDFVELTVKDGLVTEVYYNGINADGHLKTEDLKYESDMQSLQDTWPVKYSTDLENQYLESQGIEGVDALAGATYSSDAFRTLMTGLEEQMAAGDTATLVLENIPAK